MYPWQVRQTWHQGDLKCFLSFLFCCVLTFFYAKFAWNDRGKELEENVEDGTMKIVGLHPAKKGIVLNLGKILLNSRGGGFTLFTIFLLFCIVVLSLNCQSLPAPSPSPHHQTYVITSWNLTIATGFVSITITDLMACEGTVYKYILSTIRMRSLQRKCPMDVNTYCYHSRVETSYYYYYHRLCMVCFCSFV